MNSDTRFHMLCGPDGDWRLQAEHLRHIANVYRTRPEIRPAAAERDALAVNLRSMSDEVCTDCLCTSHGHQPRLMPASMTIVPPHKLRKSQEKSIRVRGTV